MHYELFHIGPLTIYTYGFLIAVGILAAYYVTELRAKKLGVSIGKLDVLTVWILVGGFVCSKILYWITRLPDILKDPSIMLNFGDGWVVYGGIIGGLLAGIYYCKKENLDFLELADLILPQVALAQGFGRLGCFFAGCCYGQPTTAWYGITFPSGSLAPAGVPLVPTQLLSSFFDFGMFFLLCWMAGREKPKGEVTAWYLIIYSAGRFAIEFFRGDLVRGQVGAFSTSQLISIFVMFAGLIMLWLCKRGGNDKMA